MFCRNCGKEMPDSAAICPNCGYDKTKSKKFNSKIKVCIIAGIVLLIIFAVKFLIPSNKNVIKKDDTGMYYLDADGNRVYNNWVKYKDNYYYTNYNGYIETNKWIDNDYYVNESGIMCTNQWITGTNGNKTYYVGSDGKYVRNKLFTIDGKDYYFLNDGSLVSNTIYSVPGNSYTSYFDENGVMVKAGDFVNIGVNVVYIDKNGRIVSNDWVEKNGQWYYLNNSGTIVTNSWIANTYYVGSDGVMLKNTKTPDGYQVGSDGKIIGTRKVVDGRAALFVKSKYPTLTNNNYYGHFEKKVDQDGNIWVYYSEGFTEYTIYLDIYYVNGSKVTYEIYLNSNREYIHARRNNKSIATNDFFRIESEFMNMKDYYNEFAR